MQIRALWIAPSALEYSEGEQRPLARTGSVRCRVGAGAMSGLEVVGFSITVVEKAWAAGVALRDQLRKYKLNASTAAGLVSRLHEIKRVLHGHREEAAGGRAVAGRAPIWEEALRNHEDDFRGACDGLQALRAKLAQGNVKRFLSASSTAARLEELLMGVVQLQRDLQTEGFFMAARDETKMHFDLRLGAATDEIREMKQGISDMSEMMRKLVVGLAAAQSGADGLRELPAVPEAPALPAGAISNAALYGGLGEVFDGSVDHGLESIVARFADGAQAHQRREKHSGSGSSGGAVGVGGHLETSPVSSRAGTDSSSGGLPVASPVRMPSVDGGGAGAGGMEEEEVLELERLEERMTKFLFKLSESSLADEEKAMVAKLVETLWGMWRVDVADIERSKDDEGQYVEIGDGSYGRVYKGRRLCGTRMAALPAMPPLLSRFCTRSRVEQVTR